MESSNCHDPSIECKVERDSVCDRRKSLREKFRRRRCLRSELPSGRADAVTKRNCGEQQRNNASNGGRTRWWSFFLPCGVRCFRSRVPSDSSVEAGVSSTENGEAAGKDQDTPALLSTPAHALNSDGPFLNRQVSRADTRENLERMVSFPTRPLLKPPARLQDASNSHGVDVHRSFTIGGRPIFHFESSSFDPSVSPLAQVRTDEERSFGNVYQDTTDSQLRFNPIGKIAPTDWEEIYFSAPVQSDDSGSSDSEEIYCPLTAYPKSTLQRVTLVNGAHNSWHYDPSHKLTQPRLPPRTFTRDSALQSVSDVDDRETLTGRHASGSDQALASAHGKPLATILANELRNLATYGWYWGPVTARQAEQLLDGQPDGTFLLRDSSDDHYFLSLTFRSQGKTLHLRVEHFGRYYSFLRHPIRDDMAPTIPTLIENAMQQSKSGPFCYWRRSGAQKITQRPDRLAFAVLRFSCVRSLQHHCRFVIRQHVHYDRIKELPLPKSLKEFVRQSPLSKLRH